MPKNDTRNTAQNRVYGASGWETLARPPSNDPKHPPCKNVSQGRIYYDDLSAVTPGTGEDPTIELPDAAARSDLEIIWKSGDVTFQIVIDHSGSMGIENKMENVKVAAKLLVDLAEFDRTTIGVIKFDDQVAVVQPLTAIDSQATKDNIKAQIDTIQPEDLTAIGDAAQKALDDLVAFGAEDTDRVVYLLTNGQSNTGSDPYLVIPGYQDADICMNTFGYGSDVNADMLRDLAEETGCEYHFSPTDMNELTQVFQDAQLLASPSVGIATDSATVQNDFPSLLPIYVDTTLGWLNLVVTYEGAPGDADLSLFDPIAAEHAANCSYSGTGTVCVFGVDSPDPGYWTLQAQATGSDVHLTYRASGSGDNVIPYAASVTSLAGGDVQYPTPIVLLAVLGKEWPITGAVVRATVQRPDGTVASLSLSDDGNSPDAKAGDGLYTGILRYRQNGAYNITVQFDNSAGTAQFTELSFQPSIAPNGEPVPLSPPVPVGENFERFARAQITVSGVVIPPVGGVTYLNDLLGIAVPWIGMVALVTLAVAAVALKRRSA